MEGLKRSTLTQLAIDKIEENINKKGLKVGDKIPTEPELIKEFGISRNTIREAISALEQMGILDVRQGNGTFVLAKNRYEALLKKTLAKETEENIFMSYMSIKASTVITAIHSRTEEDVNNLIDILSKADEYYKNGKIKELDYDFNMLIAESTHILFQKNLFKCFYETVNYVNEDKLYNNFKRLYPIIVEAIKNQDYVTFYKFLYEHLNSKKR